MSIDAGTIYSSIRLKLDGLNSDISQAVGKFDNLAKKMDSVGGNVANLDKFGKNLSLKVTAPLIAAGAASVKFASDYNESVGGIETVFGDFANKIKDYANGAAKAAGLSMTQVNDSATVLGASLQNLGFDTEQSADMTLKLTQRAADMAALMGTETAPALEAIQSLLRGQANPIERYGVGITETTIKMKAMEMGLVEAGKELTLQQKTQVRLALLFEQTAKAEGRFAAEADGMGGKTKIATAEVKNMAISLGQDLMPIALELMQGLRDLVGNFNELDEETRQTILGVAAFAVATGPVILAVTNTIKVIQALKIAMLALAANPIGLAIAGIAALALGLKALSDANNERMLKEIGEQFGDIGDLAGVSADKILQVEEAMANASKGGAGFEETSAFVEQIAQDLGLSNEQVLAIGLNSKKVTSEYQDQLGAVIKTRNLLEESKSFVVGTAEWIEKQKTKQKEINVLKEEEVKLSEDEKEQIAARKKAEAEYEHAIEIINQKLRDGLLTQEEGIEAIAGAQSEYLETLYDIGYGYETEIGTKGRAAYEELLAAVKEYNESVRSKEFADAYKEQQDAVTELSDKVISESEKARTQALAELDTLKAVTDEEKEKKQELIDKTNEYYDTLADTQAFTEFAEKATSAFGQVSSALDAIGSLIGALYEKRIAQLDAEMEAELEAAGVAEETAVEKAQAEYDAAVEGGDAEVVEEKRQALERAKIEEEYAKKKAELEYKGEVATWKLKVAAAVAQAAQAISGALAAPPFWPYNAANVAMAGVLGGIQTGAVIAAKPIKSYSTGGIEPGGNGTLVNVAENQKPEYLFNDSKEGDPFSRKMAGFMAEALLPYLTTGRSLALYIDVDKKRVAEMIAPVFEDGIVRLRI